MLVRVSLGITEQALRRKVLECLPYADTLTVSEDDHATLLRRLPQRPCDLLLLEADDDQAPLDRVAATLTEHPDRPQLIVLLQADDPALRDRALAAGAASVIDASVDPTILGPALATLVASRRDVRLTESVVEHRTPSRTMSELVAASPAMKKLLSTARRVSRGDSPVLLLGETGAGKERIAELVHRASPRASGPFVPVNCAAIPAELFESELFGHERGAFTGAQRARRGLFELAHEGTLFLDEVGDVPHAMQSKLLRALQDQIVRPIGADRSITLDVRVVAATNQNLKEAIDARQFRKDLYYRLSVVELTIPPLRERPEDVEALTTALIEHYATRLGRDLPALTEPARDAMLRYAWPGNVRELSNVIERAVLLGEGEHIDLEDLPAEVAGLELVDATEKSESIDVPEDWASQSWKVVREEILLRGERAYLEAVLRATNGRVGQAAERSGMSSRALFEKMKRHGLRKEDFR